MKTSNQIVIRAPVKKVYAAAQNIVRWPAFMTHYRWVTIFYEKKSVRQVEMAAFRSGFPCRWQSEQVLYPREKRIYFRHTRSFWTQGMQVWWILASTSAGVTTVTITHDMPSAKNLFLRLFRQHVVGDFFVSNVADKTLAALKKHLEPK